MNKIIKKVKTEDKYLIYDNPETIGLKYLTRIGLNKIDKIYYRFLLNTLKPKDKENYKYKVSICAIFKDEAAYLKEWIEFHKIVGVEHFYLYNNKSSDNYMEVLSPYIEEKTVSLKEWPNPQSQMAAYEDFMKNDSHETLWVGFIDLDEYVIPNKFDSIYDFLKAFNNRPSVIIYWKYFGTSGLLERNTNGLLTEELVVAWPKFENIGKFFFNTRYEYDPEYKKNGYMHYTWGMAKGIHLPPVNEFDRICTWGVNSVPNDDMPIQINHYVIKTYDEYVTKKAKRGGGVHPVGMHDFEYFYYHENRCQSVDYSAYKYLIRLKLAMNGEKDR